MSDSYTHRLPSHPTRLRVATYNLLHGVDLRDERVHLAAAAEAIARLQADVIALQEVDRGLARSDHLDQTAWLAERLGMSGRFVAALLGDPAEDWSAVPDVDVGGPAYGIALLTRLPLGSVQRLALPGGAYRRPADTTFDGWDHEPRVALAATVDVDGVPVRVIAAHLSYLPWRGIAQLLAAAQAGTEAGEPTGAGPPERAVLLGDLNLPLAGVRLLLSRGWRHTGGGATYPAWDPRTQLDHILVRGPLEVADVRVGPAGPSDHLPLAATLGLATR